MRRVRPPAGDPSGLGQAQPSDWSGLSITRDAASAGRDVPIDPSLDSSEDRNRLRLDWESGSRAAWGDEAVAGTWGMNYSRERTQRPQDGDGSGDLEDHIASANLFNPSDALDLLARVAGHEEGEDGADQTANPNLSMTPHESQTTMKNTPDFAPLTTGTLTEPVASMLVRE